METGTKAHWDNIFATKAEQEVSWFQAYPSTSVALLSMFNLSKDAHIIDIGGGDSRFVDALLEKGYKHIYVLDISATALERSKARLGQKAQQVHWIVSDILDFTAEVKFDFWHDRAAFHFLTMEEKIGQYVHIAEQSIQPGGYLVLGTFAENGPSTCSGLHIKQYTEASMSLRFERSFERIRCTREQHETPAHSLQQFVFCSFRKK